MMGTEEDRIPVDAKGRPDLSFYLHDVAYYVAMHARGIAKGGSFADRVNGCWGLIAKGREAIPIALEMITSKQADDREDGAGIIQEIGKDEGVVDALLMSLAAETETQARDSMVLALGGLHNPAAIPALVALIENTATDADTRWTAIESLGKIVRRRFIAKSDALQAASDWIAKWRISKG